MNESNKPEVELTSQKPASAKNPIIAAVLSFFISGLGQVYNGNFKKGAVLFIGTIIGALLFFVPGIIVWLFTIYDAYMEAQGKPVWKFK